ncbi:MAG: catalase HPII [Burkholderiales bacterium RIFCSPLOWO2_12_67_14]|nr:MAG: catalase HPII [Burkholderiales bacterium RIFCSPLOWO2_02_FULL_67_64]OGB42019.1 MAG: catalase HPII [Burkholderiales bacterium RIFCSPLOWO2_12_67_14]OGB44483.1 MAG: catalase HPII [Burkholderiales bacterium RIFCSPHIGHO2_12_FULL_67_38]
MLPSTGAYASTVSGPSHLPDPAGVDLSVQDVALRKTAVEHAAAAMPFNPDKASEHGLDNGHAPQEGAHATSDEDRAGASTVSETVGSPKLGEGPPRLGLNAGNDSLDRVRADSSGRALTTNQGVPVADNQNSLKAGLRGPTLMEDFILREKITHFDHERIPERVVHARGSGAHGYFECSVSLADITRADLFSESGKRTPVFVRFSTVAGERGSADTVRDTRGFAVKFYTQEGNWDLVGNNIPVFFIQDAMKFPDLVHAVKPEPHHAMPQASSAHDTFWDFISLMPESIHHTLWVMSDRGIPRSYRTMQGFGVHTFRFVNAANDPVFVKFHWLPAAGTHSLVWDEAVKIAGADPDFHRRDLWESIEAGLFPEYDLAIQVFTEEEAQRFSFDVLDPTKIVPEELVPLKVVGRLVLNRNPDNFFAETEQVAFCAAHVVPGIDFSNDPLLQGRIHSYIDTQITRLGGPNFHELPINTSLAEVHNHQRDGMHRQALHRGSVSYQPNSLAGGCPFQAGPAGFMSFPQPVFEDKVRGKPEKFADHYAQARLFWRSQTPIEQRHIVSAFRFELSRVTVGAVRRRMVSVLANVDDGLATAVAQGLGLIDMPPAQPRALATDVQSEVEASSALSLFSRPGVIGAAGRRVAVLISDGVDLAALLAVKNALNDAGIIPRWIGSRLGPVTASDGQCVEVEGSLEAMPSVLWDAAVVLLPPDVPIDGPQAEFLRDQYRHCKPLLLIGGPVDGLAELGIQTTLPDGAEDPGLMLTAAPEDTALADFVERVARHRHFKREDSPFFGKFCGKTA